MSPDALGTIAQMEHRRLGDVADLLDGECFVGRDAVLEQFGAALDGRSPVRIFHVCGPGGIGKSALLREVARRSRTSGRSLVDLHGSAVGTTPTDIAEAVRPAALDDGVLFVDDVDAVASLQLHLRDEVLALPSSVVVVLAGRSAPDPLWFERGLDVISTTVALQPLSAAESREVLVLRAVTDPQQLDELVGWAAGYPLALTVAATSIASPGSDAVGGRPVDHQASLGDALLARLGGAELADVDPDVLDVASLVPSVDGRLLSTVLPGHPTKVALTQLRNSSVTERHGSRVVLHPMVRTALRERLRSTDPDRYSTLIVRAADHLRQRTLTEDHRYLLHLAELVEDPSIRVGFDPSSSHYSDRGSDGDLDVLRSVEGIDLPTVERLARWLDAAPEMTVAVRRASGALSALAVVVESGRLPGWAADDPAFGPNIEHATGSGRIGSAAFMGNLGFVEDTTDPGVLAEILRVGNAAILRMVAALPSHVYVSDVERRADGVEAMGYVEVPELRRDVDGREMFTLLHDGGPDGVVGTLYEVIRSEQGVSDSTVPSSLEGPLLAGLRSFLDDSAMSASTLGSGKGAERAATARGAVLAAVDAAFADTDGEQQLRRALELAYLVPGGGHAAARNELHMSRSTFYRHLQRARSVLVERSALEVTTEVATPDVTLR